MRIVGVALEPMIFLIFEFLFLVEILGCEVGRAWVRFEGCEWELELELR